MKMNPEEAKTFMDQHAEAVILDVRRNEEYKAGHVPGARLMPNEEITQEAVSDLSKDTPVLVYCRTGMRSRQAAKKLSKLGFTQVYDFGGITRWPYEVE